MKSPHELGWPADLAAVDPIAPVNQQSPVAGGACARFRKRPLRRTNSHLKTTVRFFVLFEFLADSIPQSFQRLCTLLVRRLHSDALTDTKVGRRRDAAIKTHCWSLRESRRTGVSTLLVEQARAMTILL